MFFPSFASKIWSVKTTSSFYPKPNHLLSLFQACEDKFFFCLAGLSEIGKFIHLNFRPVSITDSKTAMMILAAPAAPVIARPGRRRRLKK